MGFREELDHAIETEVAATIRERKLAAIDTNIAQYETQIQTLQTALTEAKTYREELAPVGPAEVPPEEVITNA